MSTIATPSAEIPSPAFYLLGPTAVGKSEMAVELAERSGGEIVGADAFQVYRGLDILTAKPSRELLARARHHLIGEIDVQTSFDVAQYAALAHRRIAEIRSRGKPAIVCGGTGLYIRALTHGLNELPPADAAIRAQLEALPLHELQHRYTALDAEGATRIDLRNPRRLIRAIEVCLLTGRPFSAFRDRWAADDAPVRGVVFTRSRAELYKRIDARVLEMFAAGVVEEVAACREAGPTASQAIGFREVRALIEGRISHDECVAAIQQATRRYARRQLTWFRKEQAFEVIDLSQSPAVEPMVARLAKSIL